MRIHWTSTGSGPKTIILVHGWTANSTLWDPQIADLANHHRVIAVDLPGHGQTPVPEDGEFSIDLFAHAVESVRRESGAEKIILAGHSMGGPIIMKYARLHPGHTEALILVDGVLAKQENAGRYAAIAKRFAGPQGLSARADFIRAMFTHTPPGVQEFVLRVTQSAPESTGVGAMAAMGDPAIFATDPIPVPALGLYAQNSKLADRESMLKIFPSIDYIEIPGTDHFLNLEKPAEFNRLLLDFVNKLN